MPNHVINEVTLHGCSLAQVRPLIEGEAAIDFSVLLPAPINCWQGGVGLSDKKRFPANWYDWNTQNWGTKWNAYGISEDAVQQAGDDTVLVFQTAWNTPRGWIIALLNKLNCNITVKWLDEGRDDACVETFVWADERSLGGPSWGEETIAEGTPEHRRLHKLLWGVEEFEPEGD